GRAARTASCTTGSSPCSTARERRAHWGTVSSFLRSNVRRSATVAGIYLSVGFGFLATILATRQLGRHEFGLFSEVIVGAGFFQTLLDLTAEEALVKYGFDYTNAADWGRLRRLFRAAPVGKAV